MTTSNTPTIVWNDRFDCPPHEEVRAAAQAVLDSGDFDRPLTTSGFETTPEIDVLLDRLAAEGPGCCASDGE